MGVRSSLRRRPCRLERDVVDLEAKLRESGYDHEEVGRQLVANIDLHRARAHLSSEAEGLAYGLGFLEGLLHARLGMLDA